MQKAFTENPNLDSLLIDNDVYAKVGQFYILSKQIDVSNIPIFTFMNKQIPPLFVLPVKVFAIDQRARIHEALDAMVYLIENDVHDTRIMYYGVEEYDIPLLGEDSDIIKKIGGKVWKSK